MSERSRPGRIAYAALLVAAASACTDGGADRAPRADFASPKREAVGDDAERSFRTSVIANVEASWVDAASAMGRDCADGEDAVGIVVVPKADPRDIFSKFPAGTRFERSFRCEPPYPMEIVLGPDISITQAEAQVRQRLADAASAGSEVRILPHMYSDRPRDLKYEVIESWLGQVVADAHVACDAGTVEMRVAIADWTPDRREGPLRAGTVVIGTATRCAAGDKEG